MVSILINVNEDERINRIINRNDNQKKAEIKRRTIKDKEMFDNYSFDYVVNNDTLESAIANIMSIIAKEKEKQNKQELNSWLAERMKKQSKQMSEITPIKK